MCSRNTTQSVDEEKNEKRPPSPSKAIQRFNEKCLSHVQFNLRGCCCAGASSFFEASKNFVAGLTCVGVLPAVVVTELHQVEAMAQACLNTGLPYLELLLRGETADPVETFEQHISRWQRSYPQLIFGTGTVKNSVTASRVISAGSRFLLSPFLDLPTAQVAHRHGVPWIPGTLSPTEMNTAQESGAAFVKVYPSQDTRFTISAIEAQLSVSPETRFLPVADLDQIVPFVQAGVLAINVGGPSFLGNIDPEDPVQVTRKLQAFILGLMSARMSLFAEADASLPNSRTLRPE